MASCPALDLSELRGHSVDEGSQPKVFTVRIPGAGVSLSLPSFFEWREVGGRGAFPGFTSHFDL